MTTKKQLAAIHAKNKLNDGFIKCLTTNTYHAKTNNDCGSCGMKIYGKDYERYAGRKYHKSCF